MGKRKAAPMIVTAFLLCMCEFLQRLFELVN